MNCIETEEDGHSVNKMHVPALLKIMCTNADSLPNKKEELVSNITRLSPDIIAITEVKIHRTMFKKLNCRLAVTTVLQQQGEW